MKTNRLVQIGERTELRERVVPAVYDDDGNILTEATTEQYEVTVPIMEAQTVEMTEAEEAEFNSNVLPVDDSLTLEEVVAMHSAELETQAQDIDMLVSTTDDMILLMADIIGN